jgi:hypothetical protein
MVHRSMANGSRMADELYIKRVLPTLEDFLSFLLSLLVLWYSKASYDFETASTLVLFGFVLIPLKRTSSLLPRFRYYITVTNITYARPRPLQYEGTTLPEIKKRLNGQVIIQEEEQALEEAKSEREGLVLWTDGSRKEDEWVGCAVVWKEER